MVGFNYKSFSQTVANATLNNEWVIRIDENVAVQKNYEANISAVGFKSEEQAQKFFNWFTDNLITYQLNYSAQKVNISIYPERLKTAWTATQWNTYLANKAANKKSRFPALPF